MYLITGKYGQLANEFEKYFQMHSIDYVALDINELDITDFSAVMDAVKSYKPNVILNCAAYNFVDKAEEDYITAHKVNVWGPKNLAIASIENNSRLVHYSSDYVFDGKKLEDLYTEDDITNPLNEYGKTKLLGEIAVLDTINEPLIFRLSWVFGDGQQNFIYKLMKWQEGNNYLKIACDEFSVPTYTRMVVDVTIKALVSGIKGIFHLTNSDYCSRYEWACFVLKTMGIRKHIHPVPMSIFNLPANRPSFSAMKNNLIVSKLNINIPSWQESVEYYINNFIKTP